MEFNNDNATDVLIEELNKQSSSTTPLSESDHFEPEKRELKVDPVEAKPEPTLSRSAIEKMATSWINRLDTVQRMSFKPLYHFTVLEKDDLKSYEKFRRDHSGQSEKDVSEAITSDDNMWAISQRMDRCAEAIKKLPYTEEEKRDLIQPMADIIEKYKKMQLGPEWMLLIAFVFITLPRLEPFMPDLRKWFNDEETK